MKIPDIIFYAIRCKSWIIFGCVRRKFLWL